MPGMRARVTDFAVLSKGMLLRPFPHPGPAPRSVRSPKYPGAGGTHSPSSFPFQFLRLLVFVGFFQRVKELIQLWFLNVYLPFL